MSILKSIKRFLDRWFFSFLSLFLKKKAAGRTLLLVRTDGIGDFVFFARYLPVLKTAFKGFRIVLVCRRETAELARRDPMLDDVIGFRFLSYRWNYFYRISILRRIRNLNPAIALYCSYHRQHIGDEITLLSGAENTRAMSGNDESIHPTVRLHNNKRYSRIVEVPDHVPEESRYRELLRSLDIIDPERKSEILPFTAQSKKNTLSQEKTIVIAPGGSAEIRRWPAAMFRALVGRLSGEHRGQIILCGAKSEKRLLDRIAGETRGVTVLCGRPLKEIADLIHNARLFIGNESGLLHLAASQGTPAVGILGGGHFSRYFPYGSARIVHHKLDCYECNWNCPFPEPYCLTRIAVDSVMEQARNLLGKSLI